MLKFLALKTASKRAIKKIEVATDDLTKNEIAHKITRFPKPLPQNNSETVTNEEEIIGPNRERCISPEKRQQIINDLRSR